MDNYIAVLKKYSDFESTSSRKEYWMFVLFNMIFSSIAALINPNVSALYALFVFIPALAVTVRRLHDVGKSGWMLLIVFIPLIGFIWLLVLLLQKGNAENLSAKEVRETAIANAKLAREKAFTPKLKDMLSNKIEEELDNEDDAQKQPSEDKQEDLSSNMSSESKDSKPIKEDTISSDDTQEEPSKENSTINDDADMIEYKGDDGVLKRIRKSQAAKLPKTHPARVAVDKT
jgi:uncharacterized membrane protein YhaH (DUF805 family)